MEKHKHTYPEEQCWRRICVHCEGEWFPSINLFISNASRREVYALAKEIDNIKAMRQDALMQNFKTGGVN